MVRNFHPTTSRRLRRIQSIAFAATIATVISYAHLTLVTADDPVAAAKAPPAEPSATDEAGGTETDAKTEKSAPIEIPDGTAEELLKFATDTMRNRGSNLESVKRAARAVVDAAAKIRGLDDVSLETEIRAIELQMPALQFLARMDKNATEELKQFKQSLADDERPAIQNFAKKDQIIEKIRSVSTMDQDQRQKLVDEVLTMADQSGPTSEMYSLASQLAVALSGADQTEMAVALYNNFADRMESSDDAQLQMMAERARGSARRIGLLGNTMELDGTTADGEPFDWQQYRGRVVLVDFWASWCGPCRGEIPNMKRNLEAYGDDFAIVGINMDRTNEAMQEYIDKEDLPWVNLVGDEEKGNGWNHPIARYYGVSGIPTAILVNQEGQVVSLSARGKRLDAGLQDLLGPPPTVPDDEAKKTEPATDE